MEIRGQLVSRSGGGIPARLVGNEVAQAYYRVALERLGEIAEDPNDRDLAADIALMIDQSTRSHVVVDWRQKQDVLNQMRADIDDGFFALSQQGRVRLDWGVLDEIAAEADRIARSRLP